MWQKFLLIIFVFGLEATGVYAQTASPDNKQIALLIPTDRIDKKVTLLEGNVALVQDGDTFLLVSEARQVYKIRLLGCDAPELMQAHAERSKENLAVMIQGMDVAVALTGTEVDDAYLGTVYLEGADVARAQIESGLAWNSKRNNALVNEDTGKEYEKAEKRARDAKAGLWSQKDPIPPWVFRVANKSLTPGKPVAAPDSTQRTSSPSGASAIGAEKIIANSKSGIYHWPGCSGYARVAAQNRLVFGSRAEAETAGFRAAKNCK